MASLVGPAIFAGLLCGSASIAGGPSGDFIFDPDANYFSEADSPFQALPDLTLFLENFEDSSVDETGLGVIGGQIREPGPSTDSVDGDDGNINGSGTAGHSYRTFQSQGGVTFTFDDVALGGYPNIVGVVFTDGAEGAQFNFEAFDSTGTSIGSVTAKVGDGSFEGETDEDRFFGVTFDGGIASVTITGTSNHEVDHVQYGFATLRTVDPACPWDVTNDLVVGPPDLANLLSNWGACGLDCSADFNEDGFIDATDLAKLLDNWGFCPNDSLCSSAAPITVGTQPFSNIGATTDGVPIANCDDDGDSQIFNDIWFTFTPDKTENYLISTCEGADFDTMLAVYRGCKTCPASNEDLIACNDDSPVCEDNLSRLVVDLFAGACVTIRVGAFDSLDMGTGVITLDPGPAANDLCDDAEDIGLGQSFFTTISATTDGAPTPTDPGLGDCNDSDDPEIYNDVWFNYTADFDGLLRVSTCNNANLDTKIAVYEGCVVCPPDNADILACNDDTPGCSPFTSEVDINVANGTCYRIRVGGFSTFSYGEGMVELTVLP